MSYIYNTFFYNPIYNGLIFLIDIIPGGNAGLAVIFLTIFVSFILFSLSKKAIKTQIRLKEMETEMKKIREEIKDRQMQAVKMMELYKKYDVNPFSMIFLVLIQLPVLFALYFVFLKSGLPSVNSEILYSFVQVPSQISMKLFGFFDIQQKSVFFSLLAGITQFIQAKIATPPIKKKDQNNKEEPNFKDDFARSLNLQIRFVFPIIIIFISLSFPAALPIYWSTRNIFMTLQEIYVKRHLKKIKP